MVFYLIVIKRSIGVYSMRTYEDRTYKAQLIDNYLFYYPLILML